MVKIIIIILIFALDSFLLSFEYIICQNASKRKKRKKRWKTADEKISSSSCFLLSCLLSFVSCVFHRSSRQNEGMTKKRERERKRVREDEAGRSVYDISVSFSFLLFHFHSLLILLLIPSACLLNREEKLYAKYTPGSLRLSLILCILPLELYTHTHTHTHTYTDGAEFCEEWIMKNNDDGRKEREREREREEEKTFRNRHTLTVSFLASTRSLHLGKTLLFFKH